MSANGVLATFPNKEFESASNDWSLPGMLTRNPGHNTANNNESKRHLVRLKGNTLNFESKNNTPKNTPK